MKTWLGALLCLLPLAACGGSEPDPNTPAGQCRRQANDDPAVSAAIAKSAGAQYRGPGEFAELEKLRREAFLKCMRLRGLAPPGGVEAPQ